MEWLEKQKIEYLKLNSKAEPRRVYFAKILFCSGGNLSRLLNIIIFWKQQATKLENIKEQMKIPDFSFNKNYLKSYFFQYFTISYNEQLQKPYLKQGM